MQARIFICRETDIREEKEKKKKNIVQSRSNFIPLNILFDCFSNEQIKMAANEEEFSIVDFKNILLSSTKVTRTFTAKTSRKMLAKRLLKNCLLKMYVLEK